MKTLALLKKFYEWFVKLITTKEWIFTYPAVLFLFLIFVTKNLWMFLALAVWILTVIYNTDEE